MAHVPPQAFNGSESPHRSRILLYQGDISQIAVRNPLGLFRREPFGKTLFGFLIQVELKLVTELGILAPPLQ
jgi:hypothetical protein